VIFVIAILVIRGGPIYVSSRTERNPDTQKHIFSDLQSAQIALYGATGLPIIVAVTAVALKIGTYEQLERIAACRWWCDYRSAIADDRGAAGAPAQPASHRRQCYDG
jgi:hypothetical protein